MNPVRKLENLKVTLWLAYRLLRTHGAKLLTFTGWIAFCGLVLGVACLFVSMAVMSGFEETLKTSITDVTGHIQIGGPAIHRRSAETLIEEIKKIEPSLVGSARFLNLEGVLAYQGRMNFVILQGIDNKEAEQVLNMKKRLLEGRLETGKVDDKISLALIGKGIAKNFSLKIGDEFSVVIPLASEVDPSQFKRKLGRLRVSGILDFGKYQYDSRTVVVDLETSQRLNGTGDGRYSGMLLKFKDAEQAQEISSRLSRGLEQGFKLTDWKGIESNLFDAVKYEKIIIFFVIMIIVVAAAFNVSSALYINVIKRYSDIGILKSCGLSKRRVIQLFSIQGLLMGLLGLTGGVMLGSLLCVAFTWAESSFGLIPGSIYKIDKIDLSVRALDLVSIAVATLLICYLATLAPARRGANLTPVEGLRNE